MQNKTFLQTTSNLPGSHKIIKTIKIKSSEKQMVQLSVRTMESCPENKFLFTGGEICLTKDKTNTPFILMIDIPNFKKMRKPLKVT
jgi:hypothetical protein